MSHKFTITLTMVAMVGGLAYLSAEKAHEESPSHAVPGLHTKPSPTLEIPSSDPAQPVSVAAGPHAPELVAEGSRSAVQQAFGAVSERQLSDGRHFIQFSTADARGLALFDTFEIRLDPGSSPAVGTVEKVTEFEGIKRMSGRFKGPDGAGENDVFSITVSSDGSYAVGNFSRSGKSYALEAKSGAGWITNPDAGAQALHQSADTVH